MATKVAATSEADPKLDPQKAEFEAQKARFEEALAKTRAQGVTPPGEEAPEPEAEPKPVKKPKRMKVEPSGLEQEVQALKARLEELAKPKEPEPDEDEEEEAARSELAEKYGAEEADVMLRSFNRLRTRDRREIAEMRRIMEEATKAGRANLSRANQKRLVSAHPQLANKVAWQIVHEQALSLYQANPKKYESIEDAYDDVAGALYPGEAVEEEVEAPEEVERVASRIAASQMTAPTKAPRRESRSKEERAKEHFEFIKKNPDDLLGALRLARELGLRR